MFYVYLYLDPRKPGKYSYGSVSFLYEPFYVGKGSGNRINFHLRRKDHHQMTYKIKSITSENLVPIAFIIEHFTNEDCAYDYEKILIESIGYSENGPLMNCVAGGRGNPKPNNDVVKRKTLKTKGVKLTEEHKENISKALLGKKKPEGFGDMLSKIKTGKPHTEEAKLKMSNSRKGKPRNQESIEKFIETMRNKHFKHTEASKHLMSIARKKQPSRKKSKEEIENFIRSVSKKWTIFSPDGVIFHTDSLKTFCIENNVSYNILLKSHMYGRPIKQGKYKGWYAIKES